MTRSTFVLLLLPLIARADVRCPPVFVEHMVLQRERPAPVWGEADAGETVSVEFAGQNKSATAGADGKWRVTLDPLTASAEPRTLVVRGKNSLSFSDVLVGEVWFCSGQSNMEKQLGPRKGQKPTDDYEAELTRSDCPQLRLFQGLHAVKSKTEDAILQWHACNAETLTRTEFSAAAYYFGRELQRELGVPVGLIHSSFGGTRIESWMPREAFDSDPQLRGLEKVEFPGWVKGTQAMELYESRIKPYVGFALRGFLWYQGEANAMNAESLIYAAKMRAMVASWRNAWNEPDAPFYYALLAPFTYSHIKTWPKLLTPEALPALWEAQIKALEIIPHSSLITTTDIAGNGKDIHPTNKREVGVRFARLALAETYGRTDLAPHAPQFSACRVHGSTAEISFIHADGLRSRDGQPLTGFTLAGKDQIFHPAEAVIDHDNVVVSSKEVAQPVAVRFAWDELAMPNLVNAAGLPALPFRTDTWQLKLELPKPPPEPATEVKKQ